MLGAGGGILEATTLITALADKYKQTQTPRNLSIISPTLIKKKKVMNNYEIGLRLAVIGVCFTQIIAVPDLDICTYWMWLSLLALYIGDKKKLQKDVV